MAENGKKSLAEQQQKHEPPVFDARTVANGVIWIPVLIQGNETESIHYLLSKSTAPVFPEPRRAMHDEPIYVNSKQYARIMKRRIARAKLMASRRIPQERSTYLYDSRHKHALNRVRQSNGRFVTGAARKTRRSKETDDATIIKMIGKPDQTSTQPKRSRTPSASDDDFQDAEY